MQNYYQISKQKLLIPVPKTKERINWLEILIELQYSNILYFFKKMEKVFIVKSLHYFARKTPTKTWFMRMINPVNVK